MKSKVVVIVCLFVASVAIAQTKQSAPVPLAKFTDAAIGAGLASGQPDAEHLPIARVGERLIRYSDLFYWARKNPQYLSNFGSQRGRDEVLNQMIKFSLLADAALELFTGDAAVDAKPLNEKVQQYRIRMLSPDLDVPPDTLLAHYDAHIERFGIPPMVRVRELFFPTASQDKAAAKITADAVLASLREGASFKELAEQYAPDELSKQSGGDRGFLSLVERPFLGEITQGMSSGDLSDPVELTDGYSIIQFVERRDAVPAAFEDVKEAVLQDYLGDQESALLAAFFKRESTRRGVAVFDEAYIDAWPNAILTSLLEAVE